MAVRVSQSVVELFTLGVPNVRVSQSLVEIFTLGVGPVISCNNPPPGNVGAAYTHTFTATGGQTPYTFSIVAGALPPGIVLDPATGVAAGTPTTPAGYTFTIRVTDNLLQTSQIVCSIAIQFAATIPQPISGGGPPFVMPAILCPRPINLFDLCAEDEVRRMKRIQFPQSCNIPAPLLPWDEDYVPTPAGARPFNVQGSIVTPATAAGDVLVCQDRVPTGYDGIITSIYQVYSGSGFEQGSGDIVWRIRRNQIWLKELGNNPFSIGTPLTPVFLTQGEILFSGTQFFYFVNVPNLSGMIQIGNSRISCGMRGFYWPRG